MAGVSRMDIANHCIDLFFEWDIRHGKFRWSTPKSCFLGYNIRHFTPSEEWWTSRIHPEDSERVMLGLAALVGDENTNWSVVFRLRKCMGGYASVLAKCFMANREDASVLCGSISVMPCETVLTQETPYLELEEHRMFASMASHELKEPVRTIETFYRLLERSLDMDSFSEEQLELMEYINVAIGKLKLLLSGLGQFGSGSLYIPKFEVLNFGGVVTDVLISLRRRILDRKVEVVHESQIGEVLLDRFLVYIILQNLLLNAIKYNLSEQPSITIHSCNNGTDVVFSVTDNGMGIEEKYLKLIFEPFHRINPNKGAKGSGLGLYVACRAAEKLNGSIRCFSEVGVGSTFEVRLFEQKIVDARR